MTINADILSTLQKNQVNAVKTYIVFASLILILGSALIVTSIFFITTSELTKLFVGIGGGFISTISAFPIKEVIQRRERIRIYQFIEKKASHASRSEQQKLNELIFKSLEKVM